jgi:hypothetical protein
MTTADELARILEAERAVRAPPRAMEHGLTRLLTDVTARVAPLPVATGSLKLGLSVVSKWLMVGFIAGLGGAGAASQIFAPNAVAAPSAPVRVVNVAPVTPAATETKPPLDVAAASEPEAPAPARAVRSAPSAAASASAPAVDATTFDAELRLITSAKSELTRGRPHLAAAWLAEHAQRFPNGVFALDREALSILVKCSEHRELGLAQAFAVSHPSSPMVERLLRACGPRQAPAAPSAVDFSKIDK